MPPPHQIRQGDLLHIDNGDDDDFTSMPEIYVVVSVKSGRVAIVGTKITSSSYDTALEEPGDNPEDEGYEQGKTYLTKTTLTAFN